MDEQKLVISQVLKVFKNYKICVLGNREFCSVKLASWLREQDVYFCLRLKKNEFVLVKNEIWLELNETGLSPGISFLLKGFKVTKPKDFVNFNVACMKRNILGVPPKEGWFILTNLETLESALASYKIRFDIEKMFRDFKSGGYNLEDTKVSGERLISLILLIAIAYTGTTIQGQEIKRLGVQKYVGRVKEYGRIERAQCFGGKLQSENLLRHSSFYIGLYGQNWVKFQDNCWELVMELLRLSPNKQKYYQRGQRAMRLILSAS